MATWVSATTTSSGGNISMKVAGGYTVTRSGTSVTIKFGVRFQQSGSAYTCNGIGAIYNSSARYAKAYGSRTYSDTWYYANSTSSSTTTSESTPFSITFTASGSGSGSKSLSVGTCWYQSSISTSKYTYKFSVPYPAATSYTVKYDANGGTNAPGNQTKYQGYNLILSSSSPIRDGYEFLGWATSASATSATIQPGGTYTGNAAITYYAVWKSLEPQISDLSFSITETSIGWEETSNFTNINSNIYYSKTGEEEDWILLGENTTSIPAITISELTENVEYPIYFKAENAVTPTLITQKTYYISTYDTPKILDMTDDIILGNDQTFTLYNPLQRKLTISIENFNETSVTETIAVETTSETTVTLTIPMSLTYYQTEAMSATIVYKCSYSAEDGKEGTALYSNTATLSPTYPILDTSKINNFFTYQDKGSFTYTNPDTGVEEYTYPVSEITGNKQSLLQKYSTLYYQLLSDNNPFTAQYGARLVKYTVQIDNKEATETILDTDYYEGENGGVTDPSYAVHIRESETSAGVYNYYSITIVAYDSRGLTNSFNIQISTFKYETPYVNLTAKRTDGFGADITLSLSGHWGANLTGKHIAKSIVAEYTINNDEKTTGEIVLYNDSGESTKYQTITGDWTEGYTDKDALKDLVDSSYTANFNVVVTDMFGNSYTSSDSIVPLGIPLMFIDTEQMGVGINRFPEGNGLYTPSVKADSFETVVSDDLSVSIEGGYIRTYDDSRSTETSISSFDGDNLFGGYDPETNIYSLYINDVDGGQVYIRNLNVQKLVPNNSSSNPIEVDGKMQVNGDLYVADEDGENSVNILDAINDNYYQNGDTIEIPSGSWAYIVVGHVTNGTKGLRFSIPLPKKLDNITSITVNSLKCIVRTTGGGYLNSASGGIDFTGSSYTIETIIYEDVNAIGFNCTYSTTYTNVTNNTPVSIQVNAMSLTLN